MTDIVERLRCMAAPACEEAADQIERLRAQRNVDYEVIEELRGLLMTIAENEFAAVPYIDYRTIRSALGQTAELKETAASFSSDEAQLKDADLPTAEDVHGILRETAK